MGEVWRAVDDVLARDVAVKVLRPEYAADEDFLARFRAEARNAAMLSHHGIARVYDYGEDDCCPYLVMELVPGEPISALLRREGRLPVDLALGVVAQVGAALGAAHAAGVVHRDVKPANLILTPRGHGQDHRLRHRPALGAPSLTRTGEVMAPRPTSRPSRSPAGVQRRQAMSTPSACGVLVPVWVRPFRDQDPLAIAVAHLKEEPRRSRKRSRRAARDLVLSALAKDPSDRPAGAVEFARQAAAVRRRLRAAHPPAAGPWRAADVPGIRRDAREPVSPDHRGTRALAIPPPDLASGPVSTGACVDVEAENVIVARSWCSRPALLSFATTKALAGDDPRLPRIRAPCGSCRPAAPSSAETSPAPDSTAPAEPTSAPEPAAGEPVIVDAPRYVGRMHPGQAALTRLGLNVEVEEVEGSGRPGTVTSIAPSGELPAGSDVTLTVVERSRSGSSGNGGGNSGPGGGQGGNDG